jgi:predicted metalloendopeptidase
MDAVIIPEKYMTFVNDSTSVLTESAEYLKRLDLVLRQTPSQLLEAYMIWTHSKFLTSMMELDTSLVGVVSSSASSNTPDSKLSEKSPREQMCTLTTINFFEKILSKIFIYAMLRPTSRIRISRMIDALKSAFQSRIEELDWLDEQTKSYALRKVLIFIFVS